MSSNPQIAIRSIAHGGAGIGSDPDGDGRTWFVEGALPGEVVEAQAEKEAKRFIRGRTLRVLTASDARVEPPCPLADSCGGCGWQHVAPEAQTELKRQIVADQLRRLPIENVHAVASPAALGYRRRARLHYTRTGDAFTLGFHRARSHELVNLESCVVLRPELDRAFQRVRSLAAFLPDRGEVMGLTDGRKVVIGLPGVRPSEELEAACTELLDAELVGISIRGGRQHRDIGESRVGLDGAKGRPPVSAGPFVFAQAQREQNANLVDHVVRSAHAQRKRVLELYAGNGNFTRDLGRAAERVWTFDDSREAVGVLRAQVAEWGISVNAKHGEAERTLHKLARADKQYDVVVLDPPRAGLGKAASRDLVKVVTERVVYVSCDPSTLARDLAVFVEAGFRIEDVRVFDMMPMTPEVETVVTLLAPTREKSE